MTELQKRAKEYLTLKGVKSTGDKFIALEVMDLLCEFAQREQLNIGGVGVTLPCEISDAEDYLNDLDIYHHPRIQDRTDKNSYEVADVMADFTNKYLGN